jgi:hypothetical protein
VATLVECGRAVVATREGGSVAEYGLTEAEQAVLKMPGEFFRAFEALPQLHPADLEEAAFHVHALGRIVAMRAAHRAHPDLVPNRAGTSI